MSRRLLLLPLLAAVTSGCEPTCDGYSVDPVPTAAAVDLTDELAGDQLFPGALEVFDDDEEPVDDTGVASPDLGAEELFGYEPEGTWAYAYYQGLGERNVAIGGVGVSLGYGGLDDAAAAAADARLTEEERESVGRFELTDVCYFEGRLQADGTSASEFTQMCVPPSETDAWTGTFAATDAQVSPPGGTLEERKPETSTNINGIAFATHHPLGATSPLLYTTRWLMAWWWSPEEGQACFEYGTGEQATDTDADGFSWNAYPKLYLP